MTSSGLLPDDVLRVVYSDKTVRKLNRFGLVLIVSISIAIMLLDDVIKDSGILNFAFDYAYINFRFFKIRFEELENF